MMDRERRAGIKAGCRGGCVVVGRHVGRGQCRATLYQQRGVVEWRRVTKNNGDRRHGVVNERNGYVDGMMVPYRGWYQYLNNSKAGEGLWHDKCGGPADGQPYWGWDCQTKQGGRRRMPWRTDRHGCDDQRGGDASRRCSVLPMSGTAVCARARARARDEWHGGLHGACFLGLLLVAEAARKEARGCLGRILAGGVGQGGHAL